MGGLDNHRCLEPSIPHSAEHTETIEIRHHEIKHNAIVRCARGREHCLEGGFAAVDRRGLVTGLANNVLNQSALDGVVIDDEDTLNHVGSKSRATDRLSRIGQLSAMSV